MKPPVVYLLCFDDYSQAKNYVDALYALKFHHGGRLREQSYQRLQIALDIEKGKRANCIYWVSTLAHSCFYIDQTNIVKQSFTDKYAIIKTNSVKHFINLIEKRRSL